MSSITITDLEVFFHVGVPAAERAHPQRLLLTVTMEHDFAAAAATEELARTIDYYAVTQSILALGQNHQWKLIETLAHDVADLVLEGYHPAAVSVTVKKFILPQTAHVAVHLTKAHPGPEQVRRADSGNP